MLIADNLSKAYQIIALLGLDDHTYTHLSARVNGGFLINDFGYLFSEMSPDKLLKVDYDGLVKNWQNANENDKIGNNTNYPETGIERRDCSNEGDPKFNDALDLNPHVMDKPKAKSKAYNHTGYIIHSSIYKARPEINYIFHIHVPEIVATSIYGLLPISQWSLHLYDKVSYADYNSLALMESEHGSTIASDLGSNDVMLLKHHGAIICGTKVHSTLFFTYHLYMACKTQCLAGHRSDATISHLIAEKARNDLLSFEHDIGQRDWLAWLRLLDRKGEMV